MRHRTQNPLIWSDQSLWAHNLLEINTVHVSVVRPLEQTQQRYRTNMSGARTRAHHSVFTDHWSVVYTRRFIFSLVQVRNARSTSQTHPEGGLEFILVLHEHYSDPPQHPGTLLSSIPQGPGVLTRNAPKSQKKPGETCSFLSRDTI